MKDWQAYLDLKKKIDDFNETCPLLEMMSNKAMAERHWQRISALTGKTFDTESENFTLGQHYAILHCITLHIVIPFISCVKSQE